MGASKYIFGSCLFTMRTIHHLPCYQETAHDSHPTVLSTVTYSMSENNPRKKRWRFLKRSRSNPHLAEERGQRATDDNSSLLPSRNVSRRGLSRFLPKSLDKFARGARQSPKPEPTVAGSSDIPPIKTTQHPSPLNATTPKPNLDQSSNSGITKTESPPDMTLMTKTLAHAQTGVASISPIRGIVQNTAPAMGDLQSNSNTIDQFSTILGTLKTFHAIADQIANLHPYAKLALSILTQASKMILDQANLDTAVSDLLFKVSNVFVLVIEKKALANISSMINTYTKIAQQTLECAEFIVHYSETKSFGKRLGKHVFRDTGAEIRSHSDVLDNLMQQFRDQVIGDAAIILAGLAEDRDLRDMEYAAGAGLNTFKCCLPDTRNELLTEIKSWIGSTEKDVPRVLWLSGTAGRGKSAIAHTIANWSNELGGLGACFCFDRTRGADRLHQKIFTTIARDLADRNPIIREALAHALHDHNELKHAVDVARQWQELVVGPTLMAWNKQDVAAPVLIVIDALDESGDATSREQILRLLAGKLRTSSSHPTDLPANLRILITSRPLGDIRNILGSTPNVRHISIDDIPNASTEHDIHLYISDKLTGPDYAFDDGHFKMLAEKSDGLFEWARLACVYIGSSEVGVDPIERCEAVLARTSSFQTDTYLLDDMYKLVLTDLMPKDKGAIAKFRSVMAQIVASPEPLPMTALTAIRLHFPRQEDRYTVDRVIRPMGSLLTGTADFHTLIRPLHTSFYDFLTDKLRSRDFFVDVSSAQSNLAFTSLRVMKRGLRFNICSLENSYLPNSSVPDLEKRVKEFIPAELSYSCRFWGTHVNSTSFESLLAKEVEAFFDGERLLWWLEALALMKTLGGSVVTLSSIEKWFSGHAEFMHVSHATRDTLRFVRTFATTILRSTPHLYLSALPFAPTQSVMFRKFATKFPCTPRIVAGHVENWPQMEKILYANSRVNSVALSPDGKRIACGLDDGTIQVWDIETGEALCPPLRGHTSYVMSVAFSLDGRRIVSGSCDKTVRVWDAKTGEALGSPLQGHAGYVLSVAISPDGKRIVSGSGDETIRVWDLETGEAFGSPLRGHTDGVRSVTISPNGTRIVSGSYDRMIQVWDMETGEALGSPLQGHIGAVYSVAISPDGKRIVSGSEDKTIWVWDIETGEALGAPLQGHTDDVKSVAFMSDGNRIVSSSFDQTIRVWDVKNGEAVRFPLQGHTNRVRSVAVSPDGSRIVSGSEDNTIRVWDADIIMGKASVAAFESHTDSINSVTISPDGCSIVSGSDDRTVRVWDIKTGKALMTPLEGHTKSVLSVAISLDGKVIVSGSEDKSIRMWNAGTGKASGVLQGHTDDVLSVAVSPDRNCIVSGSVDETIRVWDIETGEAYPLSWHFDWVRSVAISSDGSRIVSGSDDKTIQVWDITDKASSARLQLEGHTHIVLSVAISQDACRIVSGSRDETIRVWDMGTGELLGAPLRGHTNDVNTVAISSNSTRIVSGSDDQTVRVWDMKTGEAVGPPFRGHTGPVLSVAISPDGKCIVSGSSDRTIRVWDLESLIQQHQSFETSTICFSSDPTHALHSTSSFIQDSDTPAPSSPNKEGWIVGPEGRILLWIPLTFHPVVYASGNTLVIPNNALQLDLSRVAHGTSWHKCREQ